MVPPQPPLALRADDITPSSAAIEWMVEFLPDPVILERFTVFYGRDRANLNMSTPAIPATPTSQTYSTQLTSLEPGTVYHYRIQSSNDFNKVNSSIEQLTSNDTSKLL